MVVLNKLFNWNIFLCLGPKLINLQHVENQGHGNKCSFVETFIPCMKIRFPAFLCLCESAQSSGQSRELAHGFFHIPQGWRVAHLCYHLIRVRQSVSRAPDHTGLHWDRRKIRRGSFFLLASEKEFKNIWTAVEVAVRVLYNRIRVQ